MPVSETNQPSSGPGPAGRVLLIVGALGLVGGYFMYTSLLNRHQTAVSSSPQATVTLLVLAAVIANLGGAALLAGLAALRDRMALVLAGAALAILLFALDHRTLIAVLPAPWHTVVAGLIGAAFLVVPWFVRR